MEVVTTFIAAVGVVIALWGLLRGEFKSLRGEMAQLGTGLRGEMGQLRTELKGEMAEVRGEMGLLRSELRAEMSELRGELRADVADVRTDVRTLGEKVDLVFVELLHHVQQGHPHGPPNQAA